MANWLATNWWQLLLAVVLVMGYIVVLHDSVKATKELKTDVAALRKDFAEHLNQPGLHRGPDFELRMMNMERQLETMGKLLGVISTDVKEALRSNK